jgi:glycosyltransferase involved in cell wall biosynthesis
MERWAALGEAIASLRAQSRPAAEIVLVSDHAPELEAASRAAWPGVMVVPNHETQGLSGARNSGIAAATGDIIAFLDDDAVAHPDWLARLAAAYADERVIGAGGHVEPRWVQGRPRWFPPEFDWVVGCSHVGMPRTTQPVRNLIGANMSFRHDALVGVDGFNHDLGRVGTIPAGCEETELCIRLGQRRPDGAIVYDPGAAVEHTVPGHRAQVRYFLSRCAAEGRSKAILSGLVGAGPGLAAERMYVRRTLPLGVVHGLRDTLRGDVAGLARAGMLVAGLLTTARGYIEGRRTVRRATAAPARGVTVLTEPRR